jgi:hypothetical protein
MRDAELSPRESPEGETVRDALRSEEGELGIDHEDRDRGDSIRLGDSEQ